MKQLDLLTVMLSVALLPCAGRAQHPHRTPAAPCAQAHLSGADAEQRKTVLQQIDAGQLAAAQPVVVSLADRYPCDASLQAAAGMTLAETGSEKAAIPYLARAHRAQPADDGIAFNLGVAQLKAADFTGAETSFQAILKRTPNRTDVLLALAAAQMQAHEYQAAANTYAQTGKLLEAAHQAISPDMTQDWALALLSSRHPAEARQLLTRMEGLQQSATAQSLLAEADEKTGDFAEAAKHYQEAARLDPSEANIYAFGNELLQHWTFPAAIEVFRYGASSYPASDRMSMGLGIAYFGNGTYEQAIPVFQQMLQASPQNATVAELLGKSCAATSGDAAPGCTLLQSFAQQHPENAAASLYAASAILRQPAASRDLGLAKTLLDQALRSDPKLADAWYQMGVLQQAQNEWAPSVISLQRAIALRPAFPEAHYRLSRAYGHMGKRDEANSEIALQRQYTEQEKEANAQRMKDVITFLTAKQSSAP